MTHEHESRHRSYVEQSAERCGRRVSIAIRDQSRPLGFRRRSACVTARSRTLSAGEWQVPAGKRLLSGDGRSATGPLLSSDSQENRIASDRFQSTAAVGRQPPKAVCFSKQPPKAFRRRPALAAACTSAVRAGQLSLPTPSGPSMVQMGRRLAALHEAWNSRRCCPKLVKASSFTRSLRKSHARDGSS
jgi:hypothetical protein